MVVYFVSGELTGKERDPETGLYYYGARYLDPRTSRWISADPAMWEGDYIPGAPINDQARERNQNLPGMGGIFNYVNFHVYHYGGNNPIKLMDPDGRNFYNRTEKNIVVRTEGGDNILVGPGERYIGRIDGAIIIDDETIIKVSDLGGILGLAGGGSRVEVVLETIDGQDKAFIIGRDQIRRNNFFDWIKGIEGAGRLLSGVYDSEAVNNNTELARWLDGIDDAVTDSQRVRQITRLENLLIDTAPREELAERF